MRIVADPQPLGQHRFRRLHGGAPAVIFPTWLLGGVPPGAFVLYLHLAWLADGDGRGQFSRPELATELGTTNLRAVSRRIKALEDTGAIRVSRSWSTERGHDVNRFELLTDPPAEPLGRLSVEVEVDRIAGHARLALPEINLAADL